MPRMLEKTELLKSVMNDSRLDSFWLDRIHPSAPRATITLPDDLMGCDVQVIFIPVTKAQRPLTAKDRLHALMARTPKQAGAPYEFHRADAYDEELATIL